MDKEARVGLLFALTMILLGITLFYIGNFQKSQTYYIEFYDINGLTLDSPVQFNGVPIGRVTAIELQETLAVPTSSLVPIRVTIAVDRSATAHLRESTRASIRSMGVLGDKLVRLVTTDYKMPQLEQGSQIKTAQDLINVEKLIAQGKDLATDVTDITRSVQNLLTKIEEDNGLVQKLISDEELADATRESMMVVAQNIKDRKSLLGLLANDPAFSAEMRQRMLQTANSLERIVTHIEEGDGLLKLLADDQGFRDTVQKSFVDILAKLDRVLVSITESKGLVNTMLYDEAYAKRVSENIEKASFHLASILEKIDTGDGTVSKLLNEPQLYDGINDIVYGVENSGFSKWYLNRKREKGMKLKEKEAEEEHITP